MHERCRDSARLGGEPRGRTAGDVLGALAGVLIVLVALAAPAMAAERTTLQQSCDPAYGCPPGQPAQVQASCSLSVPTASPGDAVTARIEHVAAGTHVTLTFDGSAVGDAITDGTGAAAVNWTVPADASDGDHSVVFVGESASCDASANGFRVVVAAAAGAVTGGGHGASRSAGSSAPESSSSTAQGTVGGAAGRSPRRAPSSGSGGGGVSPVVVAVAATAGVAAVGGGAAAAARVIVRRRRLRP